MRAIFLIPVFVVGGFSSMGQTLGNLEASRADAIEVRPAQPVPLGALPPASEKAPYRVQFGAFRRVARAEDLSSLLDRAGIPTSIFVAPGSGLVVVVTDGGFPTAEEAQRWIDFEGARRGWTERPVAIR